MSKEYLTYAGVPLPKELIAEYNLLPDFREAWGHLWKCGLVEYTIEESYLSKTGHCYNQAPNMGAALDLAGIDNYELSLCGQEYHIHLYLPEHGLIMSNGAVFGGNSGIMRNNNLLFIRHGDQWAQIGYGYPNYFGTMPPEEAISKINYLREIRGGNILIREYAIQSAKEKWEPLRLP
jgi:hypothetical protein